MNSMAQKVSIVAVVVLLAVTTVLAASNLLTKSHASGSHNPNCNIVFEHSATDGVNRIYTNYDFLGIEVTGSSYKQLKPTNELFYREITGTRIKFNYGKLNVTTSNGVAPPEVHKEQDNSFSVKGKGWAAQLDKGSVDEAFVFSFGNIVSIVVNSTCNANVVPVRNESIAKANSNCTFIFDHSATDGVNRIMTKYDFLGIKITGPSSYERLRPTSELFHREIIGTNIRFYHGKPTITSATGVTPPKQSHRSDKSIFVQGDRWTAKLDTYSFNEPFVFSFGNIVSIVVNSTCNANVVPGKV